MIYLDKVLIQVLPVIGFLYIYLYTMARRDKTRKKFKKQLPWQMNCNSGCHDRRQLNDNILVFCFESCV